ncbi:SPW repeat protein [Dactylosporangium sp. NPDC000555]|uniref:SPW repeat protein n=1 Tax=Dactylosporangium sp. NPDC000555 TaxID=3154260 RepID=UPI00332E9CB0
MVRPISDLAGHPDIVELRARYDQLAETPAARITDGVLALTGLYLAISPWVVGFTPFAFNLTVNNLICGIAVALLASGFAVAYGRTHSLAWLPVVVGVWTIITPWVILRGFATGGIIANNIVVGAIMIVLGLVAMRPAMVARGRQGGRYTGRGGAGAGEPTPGTPR